MLLGEQLNEPSGQGSWKHRAVIFIVTLGGEVQHVGGVGHLPVEPVGNILAKAAVDLRLVPGLVGIAKFL